MSQVDTRQEQIESIKLGFETTKQLTTLNAGSIVVIGTFLSDIFPTKHGILAVPDSIKDLIALAFVGFGASLVVSIMGMGIYYGVLNNFVDSKHGPDSQGTFSHLIGNVPRYALVLPFSFFLLGVLSFGTAVLMNIFR